MSRDEHDLLAQLDRLAELDRAVDAEVASHSSFPPPSPRTRDTVRPGAKER